VRGLGHDVLITSASASRCSCGFGAPRDLVMPSSTISAYAGRLEARSSTFTS